jgi:hypothetical protein
LIRRHSTDDLQRDSSRSAHTQSRLNGRDDHDDRRIRDTAVRRVRDDLGRAAVARSVPLGACDRGRDGVVARPVVGDRVRVGDLGQAGVDARATRSALERNAFVAATYLADSTVGVLHALDGCGAIDLDDRLTPG